MSNFADYWRMGPVMHVRILVSVDLSHLPLQIGLLGFGVPIDAAFHPGSLQEQSHFNRLCQQLGSNSPLARTFSTAIGISGIH
jgi:hypothetical protein